MLCILHILILLVSSWAHSNTHDDSLIIEYDKPDFQASHYQAIYNKTRNEYVVNKQRMFDVAQDFKEAKAAYTAAVNAQLGQAVDSNGNVIYDKCSWFSYVARDERCKPLSGNRSDIFTVILVCIGCIIGVVVLKKILDGSCDSRNSTRFGPPSYDKGYGGRGYRDYSQTMGMHTIESPVLPVVQLPGIPIKKKKNQRKQLWLVCLVLFIIIVVCVICFALVQDNE